MPMLRIAVGCWIVVGCCGAVAAQTARDELPAWPIEESRPMAARGPARAPRAFVQRSAREIAPPPVEVPPPAATHLSPEIVDGAVQQATYYGSLDGAELPQSTTPEPSPSDAYDAIPSAPSVESAEAHLAVPAGYTTPEATGESLAPPVMDPPATVTAQAPSEPSRRLLGPRSTTTPTAGETRRSPLGDFGWEKMSTESMTTVGASLALVIGLVMLLAWVWRKAAPRSSRPLPGDVVSVIGRVPLAGRQVAQLIKIGGKLVLVCVTPEGAKPLTEITDPEEVARLLGLCEQDNPHSATAAFRDVFDQLTREPAPDGFLGGEAPLVDRQSLADAYANTPGGRAYG